MKIVVYGPNRRVGALVGGEVVDLAPDLQAFIAGGPATIDAARKTIEAPGGDRQPLGAVKLHAPTVYRPRIACAGANYVMHLVGTQAALQGNRLDPQEAYKQARDAGPWGFWKVIADVAADQEPVRYPERARLFDYEGEVAVVLGTGGAIWGVTLLNDWSIRNDMGPARPLSFNLAKNFDTSASIGPCIVVDDVDPQAVDLQTRVNGEVRQDYNSREMTFSFAELLAFLSRDFTFQAGDVLAGGTGAGTAMDSSPRGENGFASTERFLKPDDEVEVSSPQIGALRNKVLKADSYAAARAAASGAVTV
jgi:2-keto-4-pentenoate hydratase/2-oxohepta-3-ene-1,7-dioic acid hydratase in catechol pathway